MPETVGQRLKREREARYLTLEKAAESTRIRRVYLQALEADDYSAMPSAAQGRGFLRNYAAYLDIDVDNLIAEIQRNPIETVEVSGPLPQVNLVETEIPALTTPDDEAKESAPPFWTRFVSRRPKVDAATDESAQSRLDEEELPFVEEEKKQSWVARIASLFKEKFQKQESAAMDFPPEENPILTDEIREPETLADAIMAEIGAELRARRETISLTVEEVERHTHLRAVFVKALEEGAFDKLPSTVQTRGMLSNYASFLDLDTDALLLRYADALQARRREKYRETSREEIQTQSNPSMPALRTFIVGDLLFGTIMIVAIVALALWGVGNLVNSAKEETQAQLSIVSATSTPLLPEATLPPTVVIMSDSEDTTPLPEETIASDANVAVNVYAIERVFVRISVDGKVVFEGRLAPNESRFFEADDQVSILTGNGSALRITYNGADLGLMGGLGEVVNRIYLIEGVATPTATVSPTPTITPQTTLTFTPSATVEPTGTPTP